MTKHGQKVAEAHNAQSMPAGQQSPTLHAFVPGRRMFGWLGLICAMAFGEARALLTDRAEERRVGRVVRKKNSSSGKRHLGELLIGAIDRRHGETRAIERALDPGGRAETGRRREPC